jgi:hypothetical protein
MTNRSVVLGSCRRQSFGEIGIVAGRLVDECQYTCGFHITQRSVSFSLEELSQALVGRFSGAQRNAFVSGRCLRWRVHRFCDLLLHLGLFKGPRPVNHGVQR